MVHHQFWMAVPVYLWRGDIARAPEKSAQSLRHDRRPSVHIARLIGLAQLLPVQFARGAVRVRPDVQRYVQMDEPASNAGETRSLQLSPSRTSNPLERVSASLDAGRLRPCRLL